MDTLRLPAGSSKRGMTSRSSLPSLLPLPELLPLLLLGPSGVDGTTMRSRHDQRELKETSALRRLHSRQKHGPLNSRIGRLIGEDDIFCVIQFHSAEDHLFGAHIPSQLFVHALHERRVMTPLD